ncbi:MAG: hypothetical protein V4649_00720 [Bacteroidota bacterium]
MKKLLILLLLLLPLTAFCIDKKDKKKPRIPVSRWKEVERMRPDSTPVAFDDTLFISFQRNDSFSYHSTNGFIYIGAYTLNDDSLLDFGTARYTMVSRKPGTMVIANKAGIYRLAPDLSDTAKIIVLEKEDSTLPVTNIDQMIGRWTVYKRTSDQPVGALDGENQIRSAYITGQTSDGKQGFIFSSKDPSNAPSWFVKSFGTDQVMVCEGRTNKSLKVIRCQKGEMILQDGDIKYFFKQFK